MNIKNKKILVIGIGKSGFAVCIFLKKQGAIVTATDSNIVNEYKKKLLLQGIKTKFGEHTDEIVEESDLIVISPGVPLNIAPVKLAKKIGIEIIGEIELASRFIKEPIIAISGTNGKTSTTLMISNVLKFCGFKVFTGGNIGIPLTEYLNQDIKSDFLIIELSSFQLDTIKHLKPKISILLNITEDHMDRYGNFQDYTKSKLRIFKNQSKNEFAILNKNIDAKNIKAKKYIFNNKSEKEQGAFIKNSEIFFNLDEIKTKKFIIDKNKFLGFHNAENISATIITTLILGCKIEDIHKAIDTFKMPPYRIEYVGEFDGIKYYDDSKATNPDSVLKAIESFDDAVILIMGGQSKGEDYSILQNIIKKKVKNLILMGEARKKIRKALNECVKIFEVSSMKEAVKKAKNLSTKGDVVLLSPACASFDVYDSYKERGKDFKKEVANIA